MEIPKKDSSKKDFTSDCRQQQQHYDRARLETRTGQQGESGQKLCQRREETVRAA